MTVLFERRSGTEEPIAALRFRYANRLQVPLHGFHECNGAEEVDIDVARFRQPFVKQRFVEIAGAVRMGIVSTRLLIAIKALELWMKGDQFVDRVAERMHATVMGGMNEVHRAIGAERRLQHRKRGRDADAAAD